MSETELAGACLVADNFLSEKDFQILRGMLTGVEMSPPSVYGTDSVRSLAGRLPYKSLQSGRSDALAGSDDMTTQAYRLFSSRLNERLPELVKFIGERGRQWSDYSMNVFAYPQQADLNWHNSEAGHHLRTAITGFFNRIEP